MNNEMFITIICYNTKQKQTKLNNKTQTKMNQITKPHQKKITLFCLDVDG